MIPLALVAFLAYVIVGGLVFWIGYEHARNDAVYAVALGILWGGALSAPFVALALL